MAITGKNYQKSKPLGVIGGIGPLTTALFLELIVNHTEAGGDSEHIDLVLHHIPTFAGDLRDFFSGTGAASPLPRVIECIKKLENEDVAAIAIPCVALGCFHSEIVKSTNVCIINIIEETVRQVDSHNFKKVGLLASNEALKANLFQKRLEERNIEYIIPDEEHQKLLIKIVFEDLKAGRKADMKEFQRLCSHVMGRGGEALILGCTDLSIISRMHSLDPNIYIDTLSVLAKESIVRCGKNVKRYML